jgi:nitroreductase
MDTSFEVNQLTKAIHRSQHCQRNFDLSQEIPEEHLKLLETAITQCPSKQNVAHYKVHMITNREIIEQIVAATPVSKVDKPEEITTNSQLMANLVIVFESYFDMTNEEDKFRNDETTSLYSKKIEDQRMYNVLERDANVAVGIAAGYLNLTSSILGYRTGCCQCMDEPRIGEILNLKGRPLLAMGIGFNNESMPRRIHALDPSYIFPTRAKQDIPVNYIR